jgi:hypothetical protein
MAKEVSKPSVLELKSFILTQWDYSLHRFVGLASFSAVHPRCCVDIYLGQLAVRTGSQRESHA